MDNLTDRDIRIIFDVLNVYEPDDICHVYPEMGTPEFMRELNDVWSKVLNMVKGEDHYTLDNTQQN